MRAQSVKESVQGHTEQASFKTGYGHNGRSRWRLWSVLPFSVLASSHRSWLQTAIWPLTSGPPPLSMSNQLLGWADGSAPAWQAYCSPFMLQSSSENVNFKTWYSWTTKFNGYDLVPLLIALEQSSKCLLPRDANGQLRVFLFFKKSFLLQYLWGHGGQTFLPYSSDMKFDRPESW